MKIDHSDTGQRTPEAAQDAASPLAPESAQGTASPRTPKSTPGTASPLAPESAQGTASPRTPKSTPGTASPLAPGAEEVPVDTAKIQAALEKRADQETAVLPRLTLPDTEEADDSADDFTDASGNFPASETSQTEPAALGTRKPAHKKRRTVRSLKERWWTPSVRSWFFTFMCMNMPIVGWIYLSHEARHEEDPARKEFARAYLFYKLVFLIAGAVVLLILIWIGLGLLDQLLAYMEML